MENVSVSFQLPPLSMFQCMWGHEDTASHPNQATEYFLKPSLPTSQLCSLQAPAVSPVLSL